MTIKTFYQNIFELFVKKAEEWLAFMRSADQLDPVQLSCKSSCTLEEKVVRVHVQALMLKAKCRQKPSWSGPEAEGRILDTGLHVVL